MKTSFLPVFSLVVCAFSGAIPAVAQSIYEPYSFATFAGFPPGSADGTGSGAQFNSPQGIAVDRNGNVYVSEFVNNTIRKIIINPDGSGTVSTLAGLAGTSGALDGTGSVARFNTPWSVAVDSTTGTTRGNVYVADFQNSIIREIIINPDGSGTVTTLAGLAGNAGYMDGPGTAAQFGFPEGVAVDTRGNVYVADTYNQNIRKITINQDGSGTVSTLAGSETGTTGSTDGSGSVALFNLPQSIAVDSNGNVYVADTGNNTIRKITPNQDGSVTVTTPAGLAGTAGSTDGTGTNALFNFPTGIAVDTNFNVYVADGGNNTIRKVIINPDGSGTVSTLAGSAGSFGSIDGMGTAARFHGPTGIAVDTNFNVYVADGGNNTIRMITSAGVVTTPAGSPASPGSADGIGPAARFGNPADVALDRDGNLDVADAGNSTIRKITTPAGVVTTLAGLAGTPGSADGTGAPNGTARFGGPSGPLGIGADSDGNIYVDDSFSFTMRKIDSNNMVTTLAGLAGNPGYVDGTGSAARFGRRSPGQGSRGAAVDSANQVFYVADATNDTIRKITFAGVVTTIAGSAGTPGNADGTGGPNGTARFNLPKGVAVDTAHNLLYVSDTGNSTIRKIDLSTEMVTTLAGSAGNPGYADATGNNALFNYPRGLAVDTAGNIYVSEYNNQTIRKITPAGVVTTLAGLAGFGGSADGTGNAVRFNAPEGLAVDNAGNVYVAEQNNNTIRVGNPIVPPICTPVGIPVPINAGQVGVASVSLTFPQVTVAGITTVTLVDPASAGVLPSGFKLTGAGYGYEITTTATYCTTNCTYPCPNPIIIAFQVPNVDAATFLTLTVLHNEGGTLVNRTIYPGDPNYPLNPAPNTIYASVCSLSPFVIAKSKYKGQVQQPINADGSSVFNANRGVIPVKFALTRDGASTCTLPAATIALTRTAGGTTGPIDESVYSGSADTGSNFRIAGCQYLYNLSASALGVGTYRIDIKINGTVVGSGIFALK